MAQLHDRNRENAFWPGGLLGNCEKVTFAEDIYMTTALKNHIVRDSRSPGYFVDNELLIYISSYCTESALQTLLEKYNAKIIIYRFIESYI